MPVPLKVGIVEVPPRFELGMEVLQTSALPLGYGTVFGFTKDAYGNISVLCSGADYGARTRYLHLGKVALYQMS